MIDLFTSINMHNIDRHLIDDVGISGIQLMENAACGVFSHAKNYLDNNMTDCKCLVFCGPGNNGGDGLAVLRLLEQNGYCAFGILLSEPGKYCGDALKEYEAALTCNCSFISVAEAEKLIENNRVLVIDALFGTGLSRDLVRDAEHFVNVMNSENCYVISVDIPSGLNSDSGKVMGVCVNADETVTFQEYKVGLYTDNGRLLSGKVFLHKIADEASIEETGYHIVEYQDVRKLIPDRKVNAHKGTNGRGLLMAGSDKYPGAAKIAAVAALRAGTGLLSVCIPRSIRNVFFDTPEIMTIPVGKNGDWDVETCDNAERFIHEKNAIAVGPGMGEIANPAIIKRVLTKGIPVVLDADALNCLAKHPEFKSITGKNIILTPHAAEAARLIGCDVKDVLDDMPGCALRLAKEWNSIVLLKGATSCISDGENIYLNVSGNTGLAKGGSGDTLTGIILALLCQGTAPLQAAFSGAYLLGASADKAMSILKERMLIASDVINVFDYVW